jgi:hypothetical protein
MPLNFMLSWHWVVVEIWWVAWITTLQLLLTCFTIMFSDFSVLNIETWVKKLCSSPNLGTTFFNSKEVRKFVDSSPPPKTIVKLLQ